MDKKDYGSKYEEHLLKQYTSYVTMLIKTISRRDTSNRFYIILLSGLFALISVLIQASFIDNFQNYLLLALGIIGLAICCLWFISVISFGKLTKAKYDTLRDMEKKLPYLSYHKEWELLKKNKYVYVTKVERCIPIIFGIFYFILSSYSIYNLFF